jgi:hypothetical protein
MEAMQMVEKCCYLATHGSGMKLRDLELEFLRFLQIWSLSCNRHGLAGPAYIWKPLKCYNHGIYLVYTRHMTKSVICKVYTWYIPVI